MMHIDDMRPDERDRVLSEVAARTGSDFGELFDAAGRGTAELVKAVAALPPTRLQVLTITLISYERQRQSSILDATSN